MGFLPQAQQPVIKAAQGGIMSDVWDESAHALKVITQGASNMVGSLVTVSGDWATPATAKADITNALGLQFPADSAKNSIYVTFWRGFQYPTEYATLYCGDTPSWTSENGIDKSFTHVPSGGQVTIVAIVNLPTL